MNRTTKSTRRYEKHGKNEIIAGGKSVPLQSKEHTLVLSDGIVTNEIQHDLDNLGIAKTAREEKIRARDAKIKQDAENARMAKLYREHVLQEKPVAGLVSIETIAPAPKPVAPKPAVKKAEEREEV